MNKFIKPEFKNTVKETITATGTVAQMLNIANAMKEAGGVFSENIMGSMVEHASSCARIVGPKAGISFSPIPFGGVVKLHNDRAHTIRIMVTSFGVVIMEKKDGWSRTIRNGDLDTFATTLMKFIGH